MTEVEEHILDCLLELETAARSMTRGAAKPNLLPLFGRIETLTSQLSPETDPRLLHYLEKKSYEKARLHLQSRG